MRTVCKLTLTKPKYKESHSTLDYIQKRLEEMPTADKLVGEMQLSCDYKDVTFEMLNDAEFIKAVESKFKLNNFAKLYSEQETIGQR